MKKSFTVFAFILTIASIAAAILHPTNQASAISANDWQAGNIIDDAIFYNGNSMSVAEIQAFLNSQVPVCDTWGTKPHETIAGKTRAQVGTEYGNPPPYICVKDYYENPTTHETNFNSTATVPSGAISAAQIIYNAAQEFNINPRVLLVTIKKEAANNLIADDWPWRGQYTTSLGFGCPDTAPCDAQYYGFYNQIRNAAQQFRRYANNPNSYRHKAGQTIAIAYNPDSRCSSSNVFINNNATAGLYNYTPYQPNQSTLNWKLSGGPSVSSSYPGCGAFGNINFWTIWQSWFGSTYAFVHNGVNFAPVFDPTYYLANNSDIASACGTSQLCAFNHFINYGLYEGRQSSPNFSVFSYAYANSDLRVAFGNNLIGYIVHYINYGQKEGRTATGTTTIQNPAVKLNGVDYSAVYDFQYYENNNSDIASSAGKLDDLAALKHFVTYGMKEGRLAKDSFNVHTYRQNNSDLRWALGLNLLAYYMHYINYGQNEGRVASGAPNFNPVTSYGGVDYANVYNYQTYMSSYPELQNTYGSKYDDTGALLNFINNGMRAGNVANTNFNVSYYRNRYPDLRSAFGSNLKLYYIHYLTNGKAEGRIADTDYLGGTTVLNGVDYSAVYNFNTYETTNSDIKKVIGLDDIAALKHFVTYGMKEGRQASANFNVFTYKNHNSDLQSAFGNYLPAYYTHYMNYGQGEGRVAI